MAASWPKLPAFDSPDELDNPLPEGWRADQIENLYEQLPIGKRFAQKSSSAQGSVPVIDQSEAGVIGWHDEAPGVMASESRPVVTFANHTCEMRWMRRSFSVIQNVFPLIGRTGVCDTRFLYYGTKGRVYLEEYKGHFPDYRRKWIPVPPLAEQRAIADILGTLDDKIELNRQMNEALEAMARALFKSWFVDFDPVRAKAESRDPGLPKPLADLFPDSFEDSELGEIPKGWEVGSVDDEFDLTMGQSPPGETYNETGAGLPFYQGCTDFGFRFPTRRVYCTAPTRLGKAGDTLVSVRAPVGDINMATEDCAIGRGVAAVRHKTRSRSYSYQFMQSIEEVFARFEAEGTVFGSIGKKDFHAIKCVNPPRELVLAFEARVSPLDDRVDVDERESRCLTALRDTLLPKLISGELRVKDAETFVERAAS